MIDSIQVKKRLEQRRLESEHAEGIAEELMTLAESQLVTETELTSRLREQTIRILLGVVAIDAAFFAAAALLI